MTVKIAMNLQCVCLFVCLCFVRVCVRLMISLHVTINNTNVKLGTFQKYKHFVFKINIRKEREKKMKILYVWKKDSQIFLRKCVILARIYSPSNCTNIFEIFYGIIVKFLRKKKKKNKQKWVRGV